MEKRKINKTGEIITIVDYHKKSEDPEDYWDSNWIDYLDKDGHYCGLPISYEKDTTAIPKSHQDKEYEMFEKVNHLHKEMFKCCATCNFADVARNAHYIECSFLKDSLISKMCVCDKWKYGGWQADNLYF
jgi:hypothetical protein